VSVDQTAISAQLATSLAAVNAAVAAVPDLETASPFVLAPIAAAVASEIAVLQSAIDLFDADIITDSVAGIVPGVPAPTLWVPFLNQVSNSAQISTLLNALGYLQRLAANLAQVNVVVPVMVPSPPAPSGGPGQLDFSDSDELVLNVSL
jgi:hypothetical protein